MTKLRCSISEPTSYVLHHKWLRNFKPHPMGYGMVKYYRIDAANRPQRKRNERAEVPEETGRGEFTSQVQRYVRGTPRRGCGS